MRDVRDLLLVQIRIYPVDSIPLHILSAPSAIEEMVSSFRFEKQDLGLPLPRIAVAGTLQNVAFLNGEFIADDDSTVVIQSVEFESRRILIRIFGTSAQADSFYLSLKDLLINRIVKGEKELPEFIIKAEETTCLVNLDFEFSQIYQQGVKRFLTDNLSNAASEPKLSATTQPIRFAVRISYDVMDRNIKDHGITVNPKEFVIEPRSNTPISDRIYLTKSPFSTDRHLQLLEEFESLLH